jgi:hypothetical protein
MFALRRRFSLYSYSPVLSPWIFAWAAWQYHTNTPKLHRGINVRFTMMPCYLQLSQSGSAGQSTHDNYPATLCKCDNLLTNKAVRSVAVFTPVARGVPSSNAGTPPATAESVSLGIMAVIGRAVIVRWLICTSQE